MQSRVCKVLVAGLLILGSALFAVSVSAQATANASNPVIIDLGTLGGTDSYAVDINDSGQVVGYSHPAGSGEYHAFLCATGVMTDLGTLGGNSSSASAINDHGQVVGDSSTGTA